MATPSKYNNLQVALHWLTAIGVLLMLFMGSFVLVNTLNTDPQKINALRAHMSTGLVVLLLTVLRLIWRLTSAQPAPAHTGKPLIDRLGPSMHWTLIIVTLCAIFTGLGIGLQAGFFEVVFSGIGTLPVTFDDYAMRTAHWFFVKLMMVLVAVHVIAGFYHQFVIKDRLFRRISFGKSTNS